MNLREQLKQINQERNRVMNLIEKQELKEKLPLLKKKYEGKYFKTKNSYSSSEYWWIYSYCKKVVTLHEGDVKSFQTTSDGKSIFETKESFYDSLFEIEITRKEYMKALNEFKKRLDILK